ncbi:MAG: PTS sugar transporter subunit IIA [Clostridiaceae bacterium]
MINGFKLTEEYIQFYEGVDNWEDAIIKSAEPLLNGGLVEQSYIDAMISSVKEYGPYIVIAPNIAMPHARPETGSKKAGYSILKLDRPVSFTEDGENDAQLFIALSCVDEDKHIEMLKEIVGILSDKNKREKIFTLTTKQEIIEIFK